MAKRSAWGYLLCRLTGEIPADTLEAYRRASGAVYELLDQVEQRRLECKAEGLDPWTVPPAVQCEMLCAWNAFVLQHLGDRLLQTDYDSNPATVGFVPPITSDQILAFYSQVEGWVNMAQQAHSNPNYRLAVHIPADLPPWSEVEPCPNTHLHAMLQSMRSLREHAQAAILFLPDDDKIADETQKAQAHYIRQVLAGALSKARYAEDMHGDNPTQEVHERVEPFVKAAVEGFYLLGQLIAMPQKAAAIMASEAQTPAAVVNPVTAPARPLPGEPKFDPWCLTDPAQVAKFKRDPKARQAIDELWRYDPDPAKTLAMQAEIDAAFRRGDIIYTVDSDGKRFGHFFCCPWAPVYTVVRSVTLGGTQLRTMQQFVFDVTAEGINLGGHFKRQIKAGAFQTTNEFEYGDPNEPPDH